MRLLYTVKRNIFLLLSLTAVAVLFSFDGFTQTPPVIFFTPLVTPGLISPVDVVNAGDGSNRLFIVCQGGTVRIVSAGSLQPTPFLDIIDSISTGGERGLLSIAFHPDFKNNGYFFIYYTTIAGDIRLTRFRTVGGDPNANADESTGKVIMTIPHPTYANHNGGKLNFGPDGNLYFGTGDGGSAGDPNGNAQNGNSLLGKMIRINVDNFNTPPYYTIPPDNPYINDLNVKDEIFAMGLRNPWRWSFDRANGDVWVGDVGQDLWEEINYTPLASSGGINYGWKCFEGNATYSTTGCLPPINYLFPIFAYPHNPSGGWVVTGGYVYRASQYPAMVGWYICADYASNNVWLIRPDGLGAWTVSQQNGLQGSIVGFGEAENGDLYALALTGSLYKVGANNVLAVTLQDLTATAFNGYNEIRWRTSNEQNVSYFEIEFSTDGINYTGAGRINAINIPPDNNYRFQHPIASFTKIYYRLRIMDKDGRVTYSNITELDKKDPATIKIASTLISDNNLRIVSGKPVEGIILFSTDGRKVFEKKLNELPGTINISLPYLQSGIYILHVKLKDDYVNEKILVQQK